MWIEDGFDLKIVKVAMHVDDVDLILLIDAVENLIV